MVAEVMNLHTCFMCYVGLVVYHICSLFIISLIVTGLNPHIVITNQT